MTDKSAGEALRPCPFCGGRGLIDEDGTIAWYVCCCKCGVAGPTRGTRDAAIAAWNLRASPQPSEPAVPEGSWVNVPAQYTAPWSYEYDERRNEFIVTANGHVVASAEDSRLPMQSAWQGIKNRPRLLRRGVRLSRMAGSLVRDGPTGMI